MQKHVNLVDLVKNFPTNIFLQNLTSIQKRTSPTSIRFAPLAEKSEEGSISNLPTKRRTGAPGSAPRRGRRTRGRPGPPLRPGPVFVLTSCLTSGKCWQTLRGSFSPVSKPILKFASK